MQVMNKFFEEFQAPMVIYSDRGKHFIGKELKKFWKRHSTTYTITISIAQEYSNGGKAQWITRGMTKENDK